MKSKKRNTSIDHLTQEFVVSAIQMYDTHTASEVAKALGVPVTKVCSLHKTLKKRGVLKEKPCGKKAYSNRLDSILANILPKKEIGGWTNPTSINIKRHY